jgi:hypothetical protein
MVADDIVGPAAVIVEMKEEENLEFKATRKIEIITYRRQRNRIKVFGFIFCLLLIFSAFFVIAYILLSQSYRMVPVFLDNLNSIY